MKIQVKSADHDFHLTLPNGLIFNRFVVGMMFRSGTVSAQLEKIPPEAAKAVLEELRRIRKKHGAWELVEVHSADGETVTITL